MTAKSFNLPLERLRNEIGLGGILPTPINFRSTNLNVPQKLHPVQTENLQPTWTRLH